MSLVRAIEIYDAYRGAGAGVRLGTSRVRWAIESAVAAVFEVGIEELRAPTRGSARAAFARQVAMYLAHVGCGVSLTEVGCLFERDRTTVAHACGLIEDKRDDPDFDYRLDHLERAVSCLIDALSMRQGRRMAKGCYVLLGPSGASRQAIRVSQCLVEFCLRQDWLERSGEDLVLSEAGRAMLRRAEAGDIGGSIN